MAVRVDFKLIWLGAVYRAGVAAIPPVALLPAIQAQQDAIFGDVKRGRGISASAGNGLSVNYSIPGTACPAPMEIAALTSEMERRYDAAVDWLKNDAIPPVPTPTDAQIYAQMRDDMVIPAPAGPTSVRGDYTDVLMPEPNVDPSLFAQ